MRNVAAACALGLLLALAPPSGASGSFDPCADGYPRDLAGLMASHDYPRITAFDGFERADVPVEEFVKYQVVAPDGRAVQRDALDSRWELVGSTGPRLNELRQMRPDIVALRHFPARAHQNDMDNMPMSETYPGHWLYFAGGNTVLPLDPVSPLVLVEAAPQALFRPEHFAVIHDADAVDPNLTPDDPGYWENAEHVRITESVQLDARTRLLVVERGAWGEVSWHPAGSRIAQHVTGAGTGPGASAYNHSIEGPRDAEGRRLADVMAAWLAENLNVLGHYDELGELVRVTYPCLFDGVQFDTTQYFPSGAGMWRVDSTNDNQPDGGWSEDGRSLWGEGVNRMLALLREHLGPGFIISGGDPASRGFESLSGNHMESFPVPGGGQPGGSAEWFDAFFDLYSLWEERSAYAPQYIQVINKQPTQIHPNYEGGTGPNSNFRLAFGGALLGDGYAGRKYPPVSSDFWFDEYAVDLGTGVAVPPEAGPWEKLEHTGYLGRPLGEPQRLLEPDALVSPPASDFDDWLADWSAESTGSAAGRVQREEVSAVVGDASLRIRVDAPIANRRFLGALPDVRAVSPPIGVVGGQPYTVRFWARAERERLLGVELGAAVPPIVMVTPEWRPYSLTIRAPQTDATTPLRFFAGLEGADVWLDGVEVLEGEAGLWRRDFDNGVVVVNATHSTRTVDLGESFRRISGTQDPSVNTGAVEQLAMVPSWDAVVLLRAADDPPPPPPDHPEGDACVAVGGQVGGEVSCEYVADGPGVYAGYATNWRITVIRGGEEVVLAGGSLQSGPRQGTVETLPGERVTVSIRPGAQSLVLGVVAAGHGA